VSGGKEIEVLHPNCFAWQRRMLSFGHLQYAKCDKIVVATGQCHATPLGSPCCVNKHLAFH